MADAMVGKTKINIEVEGCVYCGTRWSDSWRVVRLLTVVINGREKLLSIQCCGDCFRSRPGVP